MGKNYYEILGVCKESTETDIMVAYRKLAIDHHPRNSPTSDIRKFHDISEAYEVLSTSKYRQCFDNFGEFGLKEGIATATGGFIGGYRYIGNAFEIFERFFGSSNPFFSAFSDSSSLRTFGNDLAKPENVGEETAEDLVIPVLCTLEELYNGCQKTIGYNRSHLNADNTSYRTETHEKTIEILKGTSCDTVIMFANEGNQYKNHSTTNLVFKISELPHEHFVRSGNDLIYNSKIFLVEALAALPMKLLALDSRIITISFDEIISPRTKKIIKGEGMPIYKSAENGNLILRFQVQFPKYIQQDKKDQLVEILS